MTDHYTILGVDKNASHHDIKKAYRKLANIHHPDKGGDQSKFKEISVAYDTIGDAQKRAEYDNQQAQPQFGGGTQHHNFHDIFGHHFAQQFGGHSPFGNMFSQQVQRNRDLNLTCQVSFLDSFNGKHLEAKYTLPSGKQQNVVINVPAGVVDGTTINYSGLGDDSIPHLPRGDLHVTITVLPSTTFRRQGDCIYTDLEINSIEAMTGCKKEVEFITGEKMSLDIRQGVENGAEYAKSGSGFPNVHNGRPTGRFITVIKIKTPNINNPDIIERLRQINNEINNL